MNTNNGVECFEIDLSESCAAEIRFCDESPPKDEIRTNSKKVWDSVIAIIGVSFIAFGSLGVFFGGNRLTYWGLVDLCKPCRDLIICMTSLACLVVIWGMLTLCISLNYGDTGRKRNNQHWLQNIMRYCCLPFKYQIGFSLISGGILVVGIAAMMIAMTALEDENTTLRLGNDWYQLVKDSKANQICEIQDQFKCSGWGRCCNATAYGCDLDPGECLHCDSNSFTDPCQYSIKQHFRDYIVKMLIICGMSILIIVIANMIIRCRVELPIWMIGRCSGEPEQEEEEISDGMSVGSPVD